EVVVVEFEDQRDLARELARPRLDETQRRGVGVASRLDSQLEVIAGIVGGRVGREAAGRAVFKALVHGQDDELAGSPQPAMLEQAGEVGQGSGVVVAIPAEDLLYASVHLIASFGSRNTCSASFLIFV